MTHEAHGITYRLSDWDFERVPLPITIQISQFRRLARRVWLFVVGDSRSQRLGQFPLAYTVMALGAFVSTGTLMLGGTTNVLMGAFGILAVMGGFLFFFRRHRSIMNAWRSAGDIHTVTAEESALVWDGHRTSWTDIDQAVISRKFVFLYIKNIVGHCVIPSLPVVWGVIVVSRRAIILGDYDSFAQFVRVRVRQA